MFQLNTFWINKCILTNNIYNDFTAVTSNVTGCTSYPKYVFVPLLYFILFQSIITTN